VRTEYGVHLKSFDGTPYLIAPENLSSPNVQLRHIKKFTGVEEEEEEEATTNGLVTRQH
jgi:hypothetical protein